jgi:hypothetical protein
VWRGTGLRARVRDTKMMGFKVSRKLATI